MCIRDMLIIHINNIIYKLKEYRNGKNPKSK